MVNKIGPNTTEGRRETFVKQGIINGAVPAAVGTAIGAGVYFVQAKNELKDEFKSARQAVKDAKAQNLGKEAIKEAKKGVKELYAKAANKAFGGNKKQTAIVLASMIAGVALLEGIVVPAVKQYLNNGKKADK